MKKYGRTFHLPISLGATSDDKIMSSLEGLKVDDLVITEKMDGENTTIHSKGTHARSPDSRYHPSRDWLKAFAAGVSPQLADNERLSSNSKTRINNFNIICYYSANGRY